MSELGKRVAVAALGIPLAVLLLYLGGWTLGLVLALIAGLGANEFYGLAGAKGVHAFRLPGGAIAAGLVALAVVHGSLTGSAVSQWSLLLVATLLTGITALWRRGIAGAPLATTAITLFGALFTGGSLSFAVFLRNLAPAAGIDGPSWAGAAFVAYPLAVTWVGDTAAYFCGRAFGRHKLSPNVSPKKTWEGAAAGFAGSVITGALVGWLVFERGLNLPLGAALCAAGAVFIGSAAQVGDLVESLYKRDAGVKDSGALLPGHGGVLDRFDALFYALPVAYAYLVLVTPLFGESPWR